MIVTSPLVFLRRPNVEALDEDGFLFRGKWFGLIQRNVISFLTLILRHVFLVLLLGLTEVFETVGA